MDLFLLTIGPPILIIFYIVRSDRFPEPLPLIIKTFLLGCVLCIPAGYLHFIFNITQENAYFAGLTEETLKFLAFLFFITKQKVFDEKMDGIVYGVLISLGFATFENYEYVYVYFPDIDSYYIAIIRALSAIPMHAMCGIIMGYYLGMHYFDKRSNFLFQALFIPIIFHALYNYATYYNPLNYLILIAMFIYARKLHREFIKIQNDKLC